ncbi:MAG: response regulator [Oscillospiraceae bacterium]|nr:response regulator [Oscillospiraceae bacterium]
MYKMLIADDEKTERDVILFLLKKYNFDFDVFQASNGRDANEILNSTPIDVLFTDIQMPFYNGMELAEQARKINPAVEIVFFSGHDDFEYVKTALSMRAINYILKPVNQEEFKKSISDIMDVIKIKEEIKSEYTKQHVFLKYPNQNLYDENENFSGGNADASHKHAVRLLEKYIHEHYMEELSLDKLAGVVFLSPKYLSSIFIQVTGTNLNKYIKNVRMEKAKELLTKTNMKISDICQKVGYSYVSYFCKNFQEHFGTTPEKYRQDGAK